MKIIRICSIIVPVLRSCALFCVLNLLPSHLYATTLLEQLPEKLAIQSTIRFTELPSMRKKSTRYDLIVESSSMPIIDQLLPVRARVYCFRDCPLIIEPGSLYTVHLFLKKNDYSRNPAGLDYQEWLDDHQILYGGTLFANTLDLVQHQQRSVHGRFIAWLAQQMSEHQYGNHYLALLTGVRGLLPLQDIQVLTNTGTMHLLVVSGLHLGFVFLLIFSLCRRLLPIPVIWSSATGLLVMFGYAWLAGFALASQRAFIMTTIAVLWFTVGRRMSPWYAWWSALVLVMLANQPQWQDAGLWLSFGTVALLLCMFSQRNNQRHWFWSLFTAQWFIFPGLCLLQAIFFNQLTLSSFTANLISIPFIGLFVLPILLISCLLLALIPWLAHLLLDGLDIVFALFWKMLVIMSDYSWSFVLTAGERMVQPLFITVILALVLLHILPRGVPGKVWVWLFIPLLILPVYSTTDARIHIFESEYNLHLLYRNHTDGLIVSLTEGTTITAKSVEYNLLPSLRYFDLEHLEWTSLDTPLSIDRQALQGHLRKRQQLQLLPPCQGRQHSFSDTVSWHHVGTGCVMKIENNQGSLLFIPQLNAEELASIQSLIDAADILFVQAETVRFLSIDTPRLAQKKCIVPFVNSQQKENLPCQTLVVDTTGAIEVTTHDWSIHKPYASR